MTIDLFPAFVPILASSLVHYAKFSPTKSKYIQFLQRLLPALFFYAIPPHSILCFWSSATFLLVHTWPLLTPSCPPALLRGGPLGKHCAKVCELVVGFLLWTLRNYCSMSIHQTSENTGNNTSTSTSTNTGTGTPPLPSITMGPPPSFFTFALILLIAALTNVVLATWSRLQKSRGDHQGVHAMVESSLGRTLLLREHVSLLILATINAICEEVVSRGLWFHEFRDAGNLSFHCANLAQALCFGVWHYHGIPSGVLGVGLTFMYGWIMGMLQECGQGLLLPIVAHSIADYYIFAVLARRKEK